MSEFNVRLTLTSQEYWQVDSALLDSVIVAQKNLEYWEGQARICDNQVIDEMVEHWRLVKAERQALRDIFASDLRRELIDA